MLGGWYPSPVGGVNESGIVARGGATGGRTWRGCQIVLTIP
jgi:hypothetical protein